VRASDKYSFFNKYNYYFGYSIQGFTQEKLAEQCYLNVRSIQRMEAGEVIPRLSTVNILSEVLEFEFNVADNRDQNFWIIILHLTNLIPIVIIALIIWALKKNEIPNLRIHGINVLNFQITMYILLLISIPIVVLIGPFIAIYIWLITIMNIVKISLNKDYRYPLSYKFIKEK